MTETIKNKDAEQAKRQETNLDEGLDETFPASDAPSATQPGSGRRDDKTTKDQTGGKRD